MYSGDTKVMETELRDVELSIFFTVTSLVRKSE